MNLKKTKILIAIIFVLVTMFFSNDFGLIDIEKTAIITAIAIDSKDDKFTVTAEVAVPVPTKTMSENKKTLIRGTGDTVGGAIKNIGDVSGFFPILTFCNLIILGSDVAKQNAITCLDYFSKSLRVQDSALLVLSDTTGEELLSTPSPLDSVSSFAIQKIILKTTGFDIDSVKTNVKTFTSEYYSKASSSLIPIVKITQKEKNNGGGENGEKSEETALYTARTTAMFLNGKSVGTLSEDDTLTVNLLYGRYNGGTLSIYSEKDGAYYLLTVIKEKPKVELSVKDGKVTANVGLSLYCKVSDEKKTSSDADFLKDLPLLESLIESAENDVTQKITALIEKSISTGCDFLGLTEKLYRYHHSDYEKYKDSLLDRLDYNVTVSVYGQR